MKPFLSLLIIIAFVQLSCNQPKSTVPVKLSDKGINIAYSDTGKGDTTLLFVHGWALNRSYWTNQVKYFSGKYHIVTIDLPGFGQSGKNRKEWDTKAYGNDIDSVIAQLNLKNVILIGHSMAGDIVLQAAVNNPDKVIGIVGVDNFKGTGKPETAADKASYAQAIYMMKHNFKAIAFQYFNESLFSKTTPDSIKKRILNDVSKADTTVAVASMEENDFDEVKQLLRLRKKLYLINSDYQPTDTTGLVANKIPYQIKYIHATGHFPMVEKPQDFNKALEEIIKEM